MVVLLCSWLLWYFPVVRYCGGPSGMTYIWTVVASSPTWSLPSLYIGWVLFWVPICTVGSGWSFAVYYPHPGDSGVLSWQVGLLAPASPPGWGPGAKGYLAPVESSKCAD